MSETLTLRGDDPAVLRSEHPLSVLIGGHDEWLTPPHILKALGEFDLDPCAPIERPWPTAKEHFTRLDNGLVKDWGNARIWMNPPYGTETGKWLGRLASHRNGIALIFARTETSMFFEHVWPVATGILFIEGRLHFHRVDGTRAPHNCGAASCLIAYSAYDAQRLLLSELPGRYIQLK